MALVLPIIARTVLLMMPNTIRIINGICGVNGVINIEQP